MHLSRRVSVSLLLSVLLLMGLMAPSGATDERIQQLSQVGSNLPWVGIDDEEGTATAAWTERGQLYWALRPAGGEFGFKTLVPDASSVNDSAMAVANNGNAVLAWTEGGDLRAATRTGNSAAFGRPQVLHSASDPGNASFLDVAMSNSGRAVVAWAVTGQAEPAIRAAISNSTGTFAPTQTLMTGSGVTHPEAGAAADGAALVVWDADTQSLDEIWGASAPAAGPFGTPTVIETLGQGAGNPELDVNADGAAIVVYGDANEDCTGDCSIFRLEARYGSVSGTFSAPQNITDITSGHGFNNYDTAIDDSGEAAVLFTGSNPGADFHVFGRVSDATGTFGAIQTISGPGRGLDRNIKLAAGGGEFTGVWLNADSQTRDFVLRSHTVDGVFQAPHQLSQVSTTADADRPQVARSNTGNYVASWLVFTDDLHAWATPTAEDNIRPNLTGVSDSPDPLRRGSLTIRFVPSEPVKATVTIKNSGGKTVATVVRNKLVLGDVLTSVKWSGKIGGRDAKPGRYSYTIAVVDTAGNRGSKTGSVTVK